MRVTDLTLPIQEGMDYYCTGNLPWEVPFKTEYTFPPESGLQLGRLTMYCEPGTRFLCVGPKRVGEVFQNELNKLVMLEAVKLKCPKEPKVGGNLITIEEIKAAIADCAARPGDAILLNTGHGDDEKYYKLGPNWEPWSPCMSPESAPVLAEWLAHMKCSLFGYDTANISWQATDLSSLRKDWALRPNRPPAGGPEGLDVTRQYVASGGFMREFKPLIDLLRVADALGGIVNLGAVKSDRFKLVIAPLKVADWGYVPATAFAIED